MLRCLQLKTGAQITGSITHKSLIQTSSYFLSASSARNLASLSWFSRASMRSSSERERFSSTFLILKLVGHHHQIIHLLSLTHYNNILGAAMSLIHLYFCIRCSWKSCLHFIFILYKDIWRPLHLVLVLMSFQFILPWKIPETFLKRLCHI